MAFVITAEDVSLSILSMNFQKFRFITLTNIFLKISVFTTVKPYTKMLASCNFILNQSKGNAKRLPCFKNFTSKKK